MWRSLEFSGDRFPWSRDKTSGIALVEDLRRALKHDRQELGQTERRKTGRRLPGRWRVAKGASPDAPAEIVPIGNPESARDASTRVGSWQ